MIIKKKNDESPKQKGSIQEIPVVDWTDKLVSDKPFIQKSYLPEISDYAISIEGINYGFSNNDYVRFYRFIHELAEYDSLKSKVSIEYLKEKVLLWLIDIFKFKQASRSLSSWLIENLEKDLRSRRYYYPVHNLTIEKPFNIGEIKLTYFTESYFNDYWNHIKDKGNTTEEEFDSLFRKYQGRVFIVVETLAEKRKGEEISYKKACLAIDMIKLLAPTVYIPDEICLIDLEKRLPFSSEYLTRDTDEMFGFGLNFSANNRPFHLSDETCIKYSENFKRLGTLLGDTNHDLDELLRNSIVFIAKAIRETDLYLRIAFLIMVIESIFLLDEEDYRMEKKCKRRMCELLYPNEGKKYQRFSETLTAMYSIRHKMTHKSIREYVELNQLSDFQTTLVNAIFRLLFNKDRIKNKEKLIEFLDQKIKTNA